MYLCTNKCYFIIFKKKSIRRPRHLTLKFAKINGSSYWEGPFLRYSLSLFQEYIKHNAPNYTRFHGK